MRNPGRPSWPDIGLAAALALLAYPVSVSLVSGSAIWVMACFVVLLVPLTAALLWRRLLPVPSFITSSLVMLVMLALPNLPDGPSMLFAPVSVLHLVLVYSVVAETGARLLPLAVSYLGLALLLGRTVVDSSMPLDGSSGLAFAGAASVAIAGAWAFGAYHHTRAQLQRQRVAAIVRHERELIAGEVHDVVAHSLAVMVTQADAALMVFDRDPEKARAMVTTALSTGREAMSEMRRMVTVLREEPAAQAPARSLADLETLVASYRSEGMKIEMNMSGGSTDVDAESARAAYRIVQESLTNTLKHAPAPVRCQVDISRSHDGLDISVRDDGPGFDATTRSGSGYGIIGMTERAQALGGRLRVSSTPAGTHITARLPRP